MSTPLLFVIGYFLALLVISRLFTRHIASLKDFFLAGRTLGAVPVAMTFVAAWFGASSTMGSINALHDTGVSGLWQLIIPSICSVMVISLLFARRVARQNRMSQPEAVEAHYGTAGRFLLSIVILMSVTVFIGSQMVAAGKVFQNVLGLDLFWATVCSTGVVVLYSMLGGYFAVVATDIAQLLLIVLGLLILTVFMVSSALSHPELINTAFQQLPESFWRIDTDLPTHLAMLLTFVLAWSIAPEMWQRMSSTRDEQVAAHSGLLASGILVGLFAMITTIGLLSPHLVAKSDAVLINLAYALPNEVLTSLALLGFIAAVTSTMDSSINVGSLTLTHDLYRGFIRPNADTAELIWVGRIATALITIPAMAIALYFQNIIQILWISADIYASAMFFPIVGILFLGNPGRWSGILAMSFGGSSVIFSALVQHNLVEVPFAWPGWPYSTLIGVTLSGIGFGLGYWLSRAEEKMLPGGEPAL